MFLFARLPEPPKKVAFLSRGLMCTVPFYDLRDDSLGVKIYSTLRFGGRAVDPSLHEKEHICRHASIFVRNFSISMSFGFLFFQAPGLRRSSFRWVKAETSL